MADDRRKISVPTRLDPENAKAIVVIVKRHPLHQTGEHFLR
jgi:hypothetical protein